MFNQSSLPFSSPRLESRATGRTFRPTARRYLKCLDGARIDPMDDFSFVESYFTFSKGRRLLAGYSSQVAWIAANDRIGNKTGK
jgi:hypothetical protein